MENTSIRDAIVQHLATNKRKAALAVVERHPELFEQALVDKDTDVYAVDTVDLNAALRRGLEKIERLREVQATTRENQLKAALPGAVNRGFREQSTWWLPKQELPRTWFPTKGGPAGKGSPPASPQQQASGAYLDGPGAGVAGGPTGAAQHSDGLANGDVDTALAQAPPASPRGRAAGSDGGGPGPSSPRSPRGWGRAAAATRAARVSTPGSIGSSGDGSSGPVFRSAAGIAAVAAAAEAGGGVGGAFGRVAWALSRAKRGFSTSGADGPVMYDGGGDEAVPGQGPVVPIQPPPGYPRYTVNLFEVQQQMRRQGSNGRAGGESLVIQSDDEDEEEDSQSEMAAGPQTGAGAYAGTPVPGAPALGTGFRTLADEFPAAQMRHLAMASAPAIAAAAAKVAASNAEARGFNASRANFGMVGRVACASRAKTEAPPPLTTAEPTAAEDFKPQERGQQGHQPTASSTPSSPTRPKHTIGRLSSSRGSSPHQHRIASANPRVSSPGVLMSSSRCAAAAAATAAGGSAAAEGAVAGGGPPLTLTPTPPQQQPDGKPGAGLRAGRVHRTVLHCDTPSVRTSTSSTPSSPAGSGAAAPRVRLGSGSLRTRPDALAAEAGVARPLSATAIPTAGSNPAVTSVTSGIRNRLRLLTVPTPGAPEDDGRRVSSPGTGGVAVNTPGFSRCLLAPSSPRPALPSPPQAPQAPLPDSATDNLQPAAPAAGCGASPALTDRGHEMAVPSPPVEPPPDRSGFASRNGSRKTLLRSTSVGGRSLVSSPTAAAAAPPPPSPPRDSDPSASGALEADAATDQVTLSTSTPSSPSGARAGLAASDGTQSQYDRGSPAAAILQAAAEAEAMARPSVTSAAAAAAALAGSALHGTTASGAAAVGLRRRRSSTPVTDGDLQHTSARFSHMRSTQVGCSADPAKPGDGALTSMSARPIRMSLSGGSSSALTPTLSRRASGMDRSSSQIGGYIHPGGSLGGGAATASANGPRFAMGLALGGVIGGGISRAGSISSVGIPEEAPHSPSAWATLAGGGFVEHRASAGSVTLHRRAAPCIEGWFGA